jgi:hypothetical protein
LLKSELSAPKILSAGVTAVANHAQAIRPNNALIGVVRSDRFAALLLVQFAGPPISPEQSTCEDGICRHDGHQPYEV